MTSVGDSIHPYVVTTTVENWNRFAAINDEFIPHSMDDQAAISEGFPSAFGMGNIQWAYLHNMLRTFAGVNGTIMKLEIQFRRPNTKGQTLTAQGKITAVTDGVISLDIWTQDQEGHQLAHGSAVVRPSTWVPA